MQAEQCENSTRAAQEKSSLLETQENRFKAIVIGLEGFFSTNDLDYSRESFRDSVEIIC